MLKIRERGEPKLTEFQWEGPEKIILAVTFGLMNLNCASV